MIQINDSDMPIDVACKIIAGKKIVEFSPMMKTIRKAIVGIESDDGKMDMFDLEEIKEIADYLMAYYKNHIHGD